MEMAMAVAVMLVYIIMVITFGEPITPFAILFSLPFAGVGAIAALFIAKQPLTVSGMIGMLMLIGIAVMGGLVFSTILTLIIVPVMYSVLNGTKD
jgi:multidrug efflux pump subunit AcrB